ncbi:MAG TPA: aldehyde dehydrogenase (NADP(+)) [Balneolaceae bacterium]|nr:aldehyde dehydrogenase (NADP(+)) [Balneolaceae bacterium]
MIEGTNFIGSSASAENSEYLTASNPATDEKLPGEFHKATQEEIDKATQKAQEAFFRYRNVSGEEKAAFLNQIADEIMDLGDSLIERASNESGLSHGRLEGERSRTCNQLRMFADLLREGSWVDARINHAEDGAPDVRRMLFPLGPIAVFGASNFPLAFSTAGGDTASALAAGCPVIVKSHESHPGTNEMVARAILKAAEKTDMPEGVFSSLNGAAEVGSKLVKNPNIKAVGFTGSYGAGTAIYQTAQQRDEPIPVYAEMGSINPVFLLDNKLSEQPGEIAEEYAGSVTLGVGQFCTNPGLIVGIKGDALDEFKNQLSAKLKEAEVGCMLNTGIAENYRKKRAEMFNKDDIEILTESDTEEGNYGSASMATITASDFLKDEDWQEEVFGPYTLVVSCEDDEEMQKVANHLQGQLTVTFIGNEDELGDHQELVAISREKAGRVIFNSVPTGVRVCSAMQHGGPFPATTDSKFTSVGTAAIERFVRPVAYQDCPEALLPDELKDENSLDIYRIVDDEFVK